MVLQSFFNLEQLLIRLAVPAAHFGNRQRRADAGHHVLALGVDQKLAVEFVLPGAGVAGESHAGAAVVPHVAEDHRLHVHGRAQQPGDLLNPPVGHRLVLHPTVEHGLDGRFELLERVLRERLAHVAAIDRLVLFHQFLDPFGGHFRIDLGVVLGPHLGEGFLEHVVFDAHDHRTEHVDQPPVGVVSETFVAGGGSQPLDRNVGQPQVQNRFHHPGHGDGRAGTDRNQQRVLFIAETLALFLFDQADVAPHLVHQPFGQPPAQFVVQGTHLGGDGKARRHRQSQGVHFGQVGPFAAKQLFHVAAAVGAALAEVVDHLAGRRFARPRTLFGRRGH